MGNIGFTEIMVIMLVVLLVFGARRLPEIGSSIGKGIREFKRSISDTQDAITGDMRDERLTPPSRSFDAAETTTPPSGGEPKRLSQ